MHLPSPRLPRGRRAAAEFTGHAEPLCARGFQGARTIGSGSRVALLKLVAIDGPELRPVGVDDPRQPTPSQDGPGAAVALPGSSPTGGLRGAHEVSEHGSQEGSSRRPQQLASVARASARNPASSPSWSRSWARARTRRAARPRGRRGSPTNSQVTSRPGHRAACVTREGAGRGAGCGELGHRAPGLEAPEPFTRPVVDRQRVPEVGRHRQLGGLLHECQRAAYNRSLHPTAATGYLGAPSGQRPAGFPGGLRAVAMRGRAREGRPHARTPVWPGRTPCCRVCRPEVRAGPEWTLPAAPSVAK